MKYIAHQRFRQRGISGDVNIPAQTECELVGNLIMHNGKPVCYATSYNGQQFFARNEDGNGMERGRLTRAIQRKLVECSDKWDKVWSDFACRMHKRQEDENTWHWDHSFFCADIDTLRHIAALVGADTTEG